MYSQVKTKIKTFLDKFEDFDFVQATRRSDVSNNPDQPGSSEYLLSVGSIEQGPQVTGSLSVRQDYTLSMSSTTNRTVAQKNANDIQIVLMLLFSYLTQQNYTDQSFKIDSDDTRSLQWQILDEFNISEPEFDTDTNNNIISLTFTLAGYSAIK